MHILIQWLKHLQSFKKLGTKLLEELRSQDTQGKCWRTDEQTNGQSDEQTDGNLHA